MAEPVTATVERAWWHLHKVMQFHQTSSIRWAQAYTQSLRRRRARGS